MVGWLIVALESEEVFLCGLEVPHSSLFQLLLVECGFVSLLVGSNLALDGPAAWLSLQHGLDVDVLGWLGKFSLEGR